MPLECASLAKPSLTPSAFLGEGASMRVCHPEDLCDPTPSEEHAGSMTSLEASCWGGGRKAAS
jgi:hypothetical protein